MRKKTEGKPQGCRRKCRIPKSTRSKCSNRISSAFQRERGVARHFWYHRTSFNKMMLIIKDLPLAVGLKTSLEKAGEAHLHSWQTKQLLRTNVTQGSCLVKITKGKRVCNLSRLVFVKADFPEAMGGISCKGWVGHMEPCHLICADLLSAVPSSEHLSSCHSHAESEVPESHGYSHNPRPLLPYSFVT